MGKPHNVGELLFNTESSFCQNINSLASNTFGTRLPVIGTPTFSPQQAKIDNANMQAYSTSKSPGFNGPRRWSLEFTTHWPGYMASTASGALSGHWAYTLGALGLGLDSAADSGTTIDNGGGTSDADTLYTAAQDFQAGSILFVGASGDGYCEGAAAAVASTGSGVVNLLTALPGVPQSSDVVYASLQLGLEPNHSLGADTVRFQILHLETAAQYQALGGQLAGFSVSTPIGELPTITWRYEGAWWDQYTATAPSGTSMEDSLCAPWAGADLFFQDYGTTTRSTINATSLTLDVDIPLIPTDSMGGDHPEQTVTAWSRGVPNVELGVTLIGSPSTYDTLFDGSGSGTTYKHVLAQGTTVDGRRPGFYLPKTFMIGERPTAVDINGVTGTSFRMRATGDESASTNLAKCPVIFYFG